LRPPSPPATRRAIVIVESALIFETKYGETKYGETKYGGEEGWRHRFDALILVTAPEDLRIARFIARSTAGRSPNPPKNSPPLKPRPIAASAQQIPDEQKASLCNYVLTNRRCPHRTRMADRPPLAAPLSPRRKLVALARPTSQSVWLVEMLCFA
jgi:hypothetical protein